MYNEAMARAVLAERARARDAALHAHRMHGHELRRGMARGVLARLLARRPWSGRRARAAVPASIELQASRS